MSAPLSGLLDCGHPPYPTEGVGTGYGRDEAGKTHCYECCFTRDVARLRTATRFVAYVSSDGKHIINWPGWVLGTVTYANVSKRAKKVFVRVTDVHGRHWFGQGPAESGTYVSLRLRTGNKP